MSGLDPVGVVTFQSAARPPPRLTAVAEAGLSVNLNGDGAAWSSPMFGADYPVVPFVPNTWGGADALPQVRTSAVS